MTTADSVLMRRIWVWIRSKQTGENPYFSPLELFLSRSVYISYTTTFEVRKNRPTTTFACLARTTRSHPVVDEVSNPSEDVVTKKYFLKMRPGGTEWHKTLACCRNHRKRFCFAIVFGPKVRWPHYIAILLCLFFWMFFFLARLLIFLYLF